MRESRPQDPRPRSTGNAETKAFGRRVRNLRHHRGWSQEHLAGTADLDRSYVSQLERGQKSPRLGTILKLARALDCAPGELLGDRPQTNHEQPPLLNPPSGKR